MSNPIKADLTKMPTEQLLRTLDAVRYEIAAWKGGLAEGIYFYGKSNQAVEQQLLEDEQECAALLAELARRAHDKDNTYR